MLYFAKFSVRLYSIDLYSSIDVVLSCLEAILLRVYSNQVTALDEVTSSLIIKPNPIIPLTLKKCSGREKEREFVYMRWEETV